MKDFFTNHVLVDYLCRILASFFCGFCLGYERKVSHHAVGIRTLVLMSVTGALLSIVSCNMANLGINGGDPTRIAAGVITGIGFIGGGAILRQGFNIRGITTAAVIFSGAGIGLAFGAGVYIPTFIVFAIIMISLITFQKLEHLLFPAENTKIFHFTFDSKDVKEKSIKKMILDEDIVIFDTDIEFSPKENKTIISYMVKTPNEVDYVEFAKKMEVLDGFTSFNMTRK